MLGVPSGGIQPKVVVCNLRLPANVIAVGRIGRARAGRSCMDKNVKPVGINIGGMGTFPGRLCIRNITPDVETGIGDWTKDAFIQRFRVHTEPFPVTEDQNSEMNWVEFSGIRSTRIPLVSAASSFEKFFAVVRMIALSEPSNELGGK